jgi:hypothetical protein
MITLLITQYFLLALPPQLVPAQPVISEPSSLVDESLLCVQMDYPNVSELRVDYVENSPQALYLRSPGEEDYRLQNLEIQVITQKTEEGVESFSARPHLPEDIDWSQEPYCFKEVGTQWFFQFYHSQNLYAVHLAPYFVTSTPSCVPPRVPPDQRRLACELL